jgi:phage-related protein
MRAPRFIAKSESGIGTPKRDVDLIRTRLKAAEAMALEMQDGKAKD